MSKSNESWVDKMESAGWDYVDGQGWTLKAPQITVILGNDESQQYRTLNAVPDYNELFVGVW